MSPTAVQPLPIIHRFLDEAGDTTFYGKGERIVLGSMGVSLSFAIGMVAIEANLAETRRTVCALQEEIERDDFLNIIPSVAKKIRNGGFYFHATDDPPEVRERFVRFLKRLDCGIEVVVARKLPEIYATKHNNRETEYYADVLAHLIATELNTPCRLVLNIAQRGNSTRNAILQTALEKATMRAGMPMGTANLPGKVIFNVQTPKTEPLLNVADYLCWTVQRVFERGDTRYYDFLKERIKLVVDLYAVPESSYSPERPLTAENKIGPLTA